jgi:hypothetical protein
LALCASTTPNKVVILINTTEKKKHIVVCEVGYVLLGECKSGIWHARMTWRRTGSSTSVDFDWQQVLTREEKLGDVIGFYHTHPARFRSPSKRDDKTMDAWSTCFGKPLLCLIAEGDEVGGWIYDAKKDTKTEIGKVQLFRNNWLVAFR